MCLKCSWATDSEVSLYQVKSLWTMTRSLHYPVWRQQGQYHRGPKWLSLPNYPVYMTGQNSQFWHLLIFGGWNASIQDKMNPNLQPTKQQMRSQLVPSLSSSSLTLKKSAKSESLLGPKWNTPCVRLEILESSIYSTGCLSWSQRPKTVLNSRRISSTIWFWYTVWTAIITSLSFWL